MLRLCCAMETFGREDSAVRRPAKVELAFPVVMIG
jgi:hypothetical protein